MAVMGRLVLQELGEQLRHFPRLLLLHPMAGAVHQMKAHHAGARGLLHALGGAWGLVDAPVIEAALAAALALAPTEYRARIPPRSARATNGVAPFMISCVFDVRHALESGAKTDIPGGPSRVRSAHQPVWIFRRSWWLALGSECRSRFRGRRLRSPSPRKCLPAPKRSGCGSL